MLTSRKYDNEYVTQKNNENGELQKHNHDSRQDVPEFGAVIQDRKTLIELDSRLNRGMGSSSTINDNYYYQGKESLSGYEANKFYDNVEPIITENRLNFIPTKQCDGRPQVDRFIKMPMTPNYPPIAQVFGINSREVARRQWEKKELQNNIKCEENKFNSCNVKQN